MIINVHAGHNPDGMIACGAVGIIPESTANREVVGHLITILRNAGHTVHDCTVNDGKSQKDVLKKIVAKCNSHNADLDISIHHNSGASDLAGNGKTTGTECYYWHTSSKGKAYAENIAYEVSGKCGYRNRGAKASTSLYVLQHTKAPAVLVECCFVDDMDDISIYDAKKIAYGIAFAIDPYVKPLEDTPDKVNNSEHLYKVQVGAFVKRENAEALCKDIANAGYKAFIQEY